MKKVLLTSLLFLFITLSFSQGYQSTKYGVRAGVNISNLDFDPAPIDRNLHRNGFYFGGFAEFSISESLWLNTELQWSAEGAKDEQWKANYLKLPVQLKFVVGQNLSIGIGPEIGLKTWQSSDNFDNFIYSGVGGIQYTLFEDYFIEARAVYGFNDMLDSNIVGPGLEAQQFTIQVGVGIKI
ncbi:porin family protein [Winogradskyella litorisediminis]|uniref:Porin family protein n=1 Tax=Winogradskyella litorisediminis TaxID=1156618 RepID=A0ABW3N5X6_9FLAO